jgi:hypothetical protein
MHQGQFMSLLKYGLNISNDSLSYICLCLLVVPACWQSDNVA